MTTSSPISSPVPGGAMMTLVGGFLFGPLWTTIYVVFAATVGATVLFLVARSAVGDRLRSQAGPWMAKMESGLLAKCSQFTSTKPRRAPKMTPMSTDHPTSGILSGSFLGSVPYLVANFWATRTPTTKPNATSNPKLRRGKDLPNSSNVKISGHTPAF